MPYAMSNGASPFYYLIRHVIFLAMGIAIGLVLMRIELKRIEQHSQLLLLLCFVLLAAVFVPGIGIGRPLASPTSRGTNSTS